MSALTEIFQSTADAIRAKTGAEGSIYPTDFATSIADIATDAGESVSSMYYLKKCVLTIDEGFQIEYIPISAGEVVSLGEGEDVAASTWWDDEKYNINSHPAMTFQTWASSIEITDNELVVPDDLCSDIYVGAIYVTADGLNHYIDRDRTGGFVHSSDSNSTIQEGYITPVQETFSLVSCWVGENVTSIGAYAFAYCSTLSAISLPNGITSIGNYAFLYCFLLKSFNIPPSVTTIGGSVFQNCHLITGINIPYNISSFGQDVFKNCYMLQSLYFPCGVGENILVTDNYSLRNVYISSGITYIDGYSFYNCHSLERITIPSSVSEIGGYAFQYCYSLEEIEICEGVATINSSAIRNCQSLSRVKIPESVTLIAEYAFSGDYSLAAVILESSTPPTLININAFSNLYITFLVPEEAVEAYQSATNWSSFASYIIANTPDNRAKFGV